jgi:MFS family permease
LSGFGANLLVNVVNATLMDRQGAAGPASLSEANAGAAAVGVLAPLMIGGALAVHVGWRAGLLLTLPFAGAVAVAFGRVKFTQPDPAALPLAPTPSRRLPWKFWLNWLILLCAVSIEMCLVFLEGSVPSSGGL